MSTDLSVLPKANEDYTSQAYWDERYSREEDDVVFDWFKGYDEMEEHLNELIPDKNSRILMLGCGNSNLSARMYDNGWRNITNVDYSAVVIDKMARMNRARDKMSWLVADVRQLPFADNSFDVAIDKGTLDAFLAVKGDVWVLVPGCGRSDGTVLILKFTKDPPQHACAACIAEVTETFRVLFNHGQMLYLTFGQPHFRLPILQRAIGTWAVRRLAGAWTYYVYHGKR